MSSYYNNTGTICYLVYLEESKKKNMRTAAWVSIAWLIIDMVYVCSELSRGHKKGLKQTCTPGSCPLIQWER